MSILLFDPGGRRVASVHGGVLRRTIHSRRGHVLQSSPGPAICFHPEVLSDAARAGAERMEVRDVDERATYRCALDDFWRHGVPFDLGYGRQIALPLGYWRIERQPAQLALFDSGVVR